MTILVTGSTGKTSSRLTDLLVKSGYEVLIASRSGKAGQPQPGVAFDWKDPSTHNNPFTSPQAQKSPITAIYIVAPDATNVIEPMTKFLDFAKDKGVKRFVLLSASMIDADGPLLGPVHKHILTMGVEWAVLRPTWFMENLIQEGAGYKLDQIKNENVIRTATGNGKLPFVSVDDIAAVAFRALVDEKAHNTDHIILGPELLTYGDVGIPAHPSLAVY